jgi:hypothetical protein
MGFALHYGPCEHDCPPCIEPNQHHRPWINGALTEFEGLPKSSRTAPAPILAGLDKTLPGLGGHSDQQSRDVSEAWFPRVTSHIFNHNLCLHGCHGTVNNQGIDTDQHVRRALCHRCQKPALAFNKAGMSLCGRHATIGVDTSHATLSTCPSKAARWDIRVKKPSSNP